MENRSKANNRDETSSITSSFNSLVSSFVSAPMPPRKNLSDKLHALTDAPGKPPAVSSSPISTTASPVSRNGSSKDTLRGIEEAFKLLRTQVESEYGSLTSPAQNQSSMKELKTKMDDQNTSHLTQVGQLKRQVEIDLRDNITNAIKAQLDKSIKTSLKGRINTEVEKQIPTFVPSSLQKQLDDVRSRKLELQAALHNHRARHENSMLDRGAVDDKLTRLVNEHGVPCKIFPTNMRSFLYYEESDLQNLYDHFSLGKIHPTDRTASLNRFMVFMGVSFQVACPPPPGLPTPTSPITMPKNIGARSTC